MSESNNDTQSAAVAPGNSHVFARRVNYFNGQLLDASDFKVEQKYGRTLLQQSHSNLYGRGIARGLDVQWYPDSGNLAITQGLALDGRGRMIVLGENVEVQLPRIQGSGEQRRYLVIRYREIETEYREFEGTEALKHVTGNTRIEESADLDVLAEEPRDGTLDILLALLTFTNGKLTDVDVSGRSYTRLAAGDLQAKSITFLTVEDLPSSLRIDSWRENQNEGLRIHAPETIFSDSVAVDAALRVGPVPQQMQGAGGEPRLRVHGTSSLAELGDTAPVTVSGNHRGTHVGFNAYNDGMQWRGISQGSYAAAMSFDASNGALVLGTAAARAEQSNPVLIEDALRIAADGTVHIGAVDGSFSRLSVGGVGHTSASFGPTNPLTTVFDAPGLGFNAYRDEQTWRVVTPNKPAARLELDTDGVILATETGGPAASSGAPVQLDRRLRVNEKGLEVFGDVNAQGNLSSRDTGVITGVRWKGLRPKVEVGNILFQGAENGKPRKFPLPDAVPEGAVEVLIYAYAGLRNNDTDQSVELSIFTQDGTDVFAHYLYLRNFEVHPTKSWKDWLEHKPVYWHSTSGNFWLPVPQSREIQLSITWFPGNVAPGTGEGTIYVSGYR